MAAVITEPGEVEQAQGELPLTPVQILDRAVAGSRSMGGANAPAITLGFGWRTAEEQAADEHRDRGARR